MGNVRIQDTNAIKTKGIGMDHIIESPIPKQKEFIISIFLQRKRKRLRPCVITIKESGRE